MVKWSSSWLPNSNPRPPASAIRRILVVGDKLVAGLLCDELRAAGHDSFSAHSGLSGLITAVKRRPEVTLIDLALPDMDGIDLANSIRCNEELDDMVLIALSGNAKEQAYWESRGVAIDRYLVKPIDLPQLANLIQTTWRLTRKQPLGGKQQFGHRNRSAG